MSATMSSERGLDAADYAVFGTLTIAGYLVGLYFSIPRKSSRTGVIEAASLGGRSLPTAALAVSVMASAANSLSVVSFVGHYYAHGFNLMWVLAAIPLAAYVTAVSVVPLLYHLRVVSIFQYLRMRFDNKVGVAACIIYFILSQTLGAVGIYSAATAVSTMFHVPLLASNVAIGLAGTVYTALGGLRSVVWADCVQALVMFAAPLSIIGKVLYDSGSAIPPLRSMSDFNYAEYVFRTDFDVSSDENIWSTLVSAMPYTLVRVAFDQMSVQRFMAARTLQAAKRTAVAGGLFVLFFFTIAITAGVALIYWYRDCDPVLRGAIKTFDQVVPYYMRERLADVATLRGFFLAGLVGASTSTVSSIVNSHAATFYIDVISPYLKIREQRATILMRLLAMISGTVMTLYAIAIPLMGTATRLFVSLYSSASGPFAGLVLLAVSSPWVNAKGAAWGSVLVCALQLWHALGRSMWGSCIPPFLPRNLDRCPTATNASTPQPTIDSASLNRMDVFPLYQLSFLWICVIGAVLTMLSGTVISLLTGGAKDVRKNLPLTSPSFLAVWRRFKSLRRILTDAEKMEQHGEEVLPLRNDARAAVAVELTTMG